MPAIGMEDVRIPMVAITIGVLVLVYFMVLRAAKKDEDHDQICPVCGDRRDQAPVEHWRPGARYCETCGRVTDREREGAVAPGVGGGHV